MFWGLVLEPGKRYSTTVEKSFHVSKAALDCSSIRNDNEILSVMLETEGSESLLCNLCKHKGLLQESLDLNFMTGDRLTFECRGHGRIHLSGYLLPDEDDDMSGMLGDEEESEEEEEIEPSVASSPEKSKKEKRKLEAPPDSPPKKKKGIAVKEGESDSEQDEESDLSEEMDDDDDDIDDDEEDENEEGSDKDEDDDESEEDDSFTLTPQEKQKQHKQDKIKSPNKQSPNAQKKSPVTNGVTPKEQKQNKKAQGGDKTTPNANTTPKQKQILDLGVLVKEMKHGNGVPVKSGKTVTVFYVGKLKESGKVFDKQMKGEGFKFKLGRGEVIKGWDIGLQGMKVGGKRVIHCPPEAGYGAKGVPPKIPPNSTLIFEVELKNVQ